LQKKGDIGPNGYAPKSQGDCRVPTSDELDRNTIGAAELGEARATGNPAPPIAEGHTDPHAAGRTARKALFRPASASPRGKMCCPARRRSLSQRPRFEVAIHLRSVRLAHRAHAAGERHESRAHRLQRGRAQVTRTPVRSNTRARRAGRRGGVGHRAGHAPRCRRAAPS